MPFRIKSGNAFPYANPINQLANSSVNRDLNLNKEGNDYAYENIHAPLLCFREFGHWRARNLKLTLSDMSKCFVPTSRKLVRFSNI